MQRLRTWTRGHIEVLCAWQRQGSKLFADGPRLMAIYTHLKTLPLALQRQWRRRCKATLWGVALCLAASGVTPAAANTITVNGSCTLVDAITAANTATATGSCSAGSGADTIVLTVDTALTTSNNSTYGPTGLPVILSEITIEGNGHTISRDAGAANFRLLAVSDTGDLTLRDTTLSGGAGNRGRGIYNLYKLQSVFAQGLEGDRNQELIAQGNQEPLLPGQSCSLGDPKLPGGRVNTQGPPEPSFGTAADALLWQKFKVTPGQASEEQSSWAKEQAFQEDLARKQRERAPVRAEQLSDEQVKALSKALLSLRKDVQGAVAAEEETKTGARVQTEINKKADPENLKKIGETTQRTEERASTGRELGKLDPEVLRRGADQFAAEEKQKQEVELARRLSVAEQKAYGVDASWTLGDVVRGSIQAMDEKDRGVMASIATGRDAISRMRYYASQVNDFSPSGMLWARSTQWLRDATQTGKPEYRALANLTLEVRSILNAKGESGKAIAVEVEDIQMTASALADSTLTRDYAGFLLDRVDITLLEANKTVLDKYTPQSEQSLRQRKVDTERAIERLKGPEQKEFERRTRQYRYKGQEKGGTDTEEGWKARAKKAGKTFSRENLLPEIRSGATLGAPPTSPPKTPGLKEDPITPQTPLFMGGHPEMGAYTFEGWQSAGPKAGLNLSDQHFYRTEAEAREDKEAVQER